MEKKITKRQSLENIKAILAGNGDAYAAEIEFIEKEIKLIDGRNEREKERRAEKQAEGDEFGKAVIEAIGETPKTATEILAELVENFPEATRSKVIYRANKAVKDGFAFKTKVKVEKSNLVAYSTKAPAEVEE